MEKTPQGREKGSDKLSLSVKSEVERLKKQGHNLELVETPDNFNIEVKDKSGKWMKTHVFPKWDKIPMREGDSGPPDVYVPIADRIREVLEAPKEE